MLARVSPPAFASAAAALAALGLCGFALWVGDDTAYASVAALYAALAFWAWRTRAPGDPGRLNPLDAAMAFFALALGARTLASAHAWQAWAIAPAYLLYPFGYFAARLVRAPSPRALLLGFVAPLLLALCAGVFRDVLAGARMVEGALADPNSLAALIAAFTLAAAFLAFGAARMPRLGVAVLLVAAPALYYTESRAVPVGLAALGATFGVAWIAARWAVWQDRRRTLAVALAGTLVVLAALGAAGYIQAKLARPDISLQARMALLQTAFRIGFEAGPWTGAGIGAFARQYPALRPLTDPESAGVRAHNDYVELFADGGLLLSGALLLVSAMLARSALLAWRERKLVQGALLAAATYLGLHAAMNHLYIYPVAALAAGLLAGWGQDGAPAQARATRRRARALAPLVGASVLLVPILLFFSLGEASVRAATAEASASGWPGPHSQRVLRFYAESGLMPRAAFAWGLQAEITLSGMPPDAPGRWTLAREALGRYVLAFGQYRDSAYAYRIARLLELTPEFVANAALAEEIPVWYAMAIRLDRVNLVAVLRYADWLARQHREGDALELLEEGLRRVWRPAIQRPLIEERARIRRLLEARQAPGGQKPSGAPPGAVNAPARNA